MRDSIRITKAANGYMIEARDPEIEKANRSTAAPWCDPCVTILATWRFAALACDFQQIPNNGFRFVDLQGVEAGRKENRLNTFHSASIDASPG